VLALIQTAKYSGQIVFTSAASPGWQYRHCFLSQSREISHSSVTDGYRVVIQKMTRNGIAVAESKGFRHSSGEK
jgi:hypothetical protein